MTPEQMREFAGLVVQEMGLAGWAWALLVVVGAAIGAFGGAYLKKRAENLATKTDFEEIKRQLKETTEAAEEVKRSINDRGWIAQQRWGRREAHYIELITAFIKFEQVCAEVSGHLELAENGAKFKSEVWEKYVEAAKAVHAAAGLAGLFIPDGAPKEVSAFFSFKSEPAAGGPPVTARDVDKRAAAAVLARQALITQALKDLAAIDPDFEKKSFGPPA